MILTDREIEELINKTGCIKPFDPELLNPQSLDVRLSNIFTKVYKDTSHRYITASDKSSIHNVTFDADFIMLEPGEMVLGCLIEEFDIPPDICVSLKGRSSLGRLGIDNSSFAGWIDGGFIGSLTIELANHSKNLIRLNTGDRIGQLVFERTAMPRKSYRQKDTSKYVGQSPGQGSKGI